MSVDQLVRYWYGMGKQMMNEKQNTLFMGLYVCVCGYFDTHYRRPEKPRARDQNDKV